MVAVFQTVTDLDLLRATLLNRARLTDHGCWEWQASKDGAGYGQISVRNRTRRAHRVAFEAFKHEIPQGAVLCHSCDNPSCINPEHLRVGTQKDNARDREMRGRRDVKGEQIGTAKLTEQDALAIKMSDLPARVLSDIFSVDKSQIWNIRAGRSWKHLNKAAAMLEETTNGR